MNPGALRPSGRSSRTTLVVWGLASILFLFTVENIWIDPWLRNKSHDLPSMVPEALGGSWFLVLMVGGIMLAFLVMCQILLTKDRSLSVWTKVGTGTAVLVVLLLSALWVGMTSGLSPAIRLQPRGTPHTVALKWRPSGAQVAGYNVYRSTTPAGNYVQINSSLIQGATFTDNAVESGVTYYYVTRAVDALGHESVNSNEARASIP
jgi:hypothetical protein